MPYKDRVDKNKCDMKYYYAHKDTIAEKRRVYSKEYRERNREKLLSQSKQKRELNRDIINEQKRNEYIKLKNIPEFRYKKYIRMAALRNLIFDLTLDQFVEFWGKACYYCGSSVEGIGLDRIDSNIGYTYTNVVSCCPFCNYMKASHNTDEFINHCRKVVKHWDTIFKPTK